MIPEWLNRLSVCADFVRSGSLRLLFRNVKRRGLFIVSLLIGGVDFEEKRISAPAGPIHDLLRHALLSVADIAFVVIKPYICME